MSENFIVVIPEDPRFVPEESRRQRAAARFREIAPEAGEIQVKVTDSIEFFDCGGNFERVVCPACQEEIDIEWWQDCMEKDYGDGFRLAKYATPCCGALHALDELHYEWPQGFARFAIDAPNPNIGRLDDKYRKELEDILGTRLRVIYQHL